MDGGNTKQEQNPAFQYTAQTVSPIVNDESKLTIGENSLSVTALFDVAEIAYAEINTLSFADYVVTVKTDGGDYNFSRMGNWAQPFYDALCDAYNKAVLRSFFIKDTPILTAKGDYRYSEKNISGSGSAPVHVYENNVTALPPDLSARRVPLCFVTAMDKGDYELTLTLNTGESYTYTKLGYDTVPFADAVEKQIRALREKSLLAIKELDPTLSAAQASQLAKIMPEGAAAPFGQIVNIAPTFAAAVEEKINQTRAAEYYAVFKELCDPMSIYVGFRKNDTRESSGSTPDLNNITPDIDVNIDSLLGGFAGDIQQSEDDSEPSQDAYLLWLIVPSPDGQYAVVEFAQVDSATFIYETGGDFSRFAQQLNRALEAINFKREVIRLSDEDLRKPENVDYFMAAKRTASLQFVRNNFTERLIHSSPESWKRKLTEIWNALR